MKKLLVVFSLFVIALSFTGCVMTKQVAYFQNMDSVDLSGQKAMPEIHIKPNDELTILVSALNPEAARPFNMSTTATSNTMSGNSTASKSLYSYIVDTNGKIVLKNKHEILMGPNGNGDVYKALLRNGLIDDMKKNNIIKIGTIAQFCEK